jgi:hypothetical protein
VKKAWQAFGKTLAKRSSIKKDQTGICFRERAVGAQHPLFNQENPAGINPDFSSNNRLFRDPRTAHVTWHHM